MPIPRTHADIQERKARDFFRKQIINDTITTLTSVDDNRLKMMIEQIVNEHVKLTGTDGFYHNGRVFTNNVGIPWTSLQRQPVHESLKDRVAEYWNQCRELDADKAKISQGLAVLIREANSHQEVRDAFPEPLVKIMPVLNSLERKRPEAYSLTSKLHIQQLEKTMDRVFFYLGSRLMG